MKKIDRIGEVSTNKQGLLMEIVEYTNNKDIVVEFLATGEKKRTCYQHFKNGMVKADIVVEQPIEVVEVSEAPTATEGGAVAIAVSFIAMILVSIILALIFK